MSKIVFAIGHGKSANGGYDSGATHNGYHEFKIAREIGKYAQEYYNVHYNEHCDLMNYEGSLSLKDRINKLQDDTYDLVAEFHLNAAGGLGTECYYHHYSKQGKKLAEEITKNISKDLGVKNRGAKVKLNLYGKDYFGIIRQTKPCAILIETVFIDSTDLETVKTAEGQRKCGESIARAVATVRGVSKKEIQNDTPEEKPSKLTEKPKEKFNMAKTYKNGSTPENVYADTALKNKIGTLDKYEQCECLDKVNGRFLVKYKVNGTGTYKTGFVKYNGGLD